MARLLFPKISENNQVLLKVSAVHKIYVEESGNPEGIPVLYLHGGPGGGASENHRRLFDPQQYRIILFDQRGCGRSIPAVSIEENTTDALVRDIEFIRNHLNITKWLVCGGSWGTTLAMVYGIKHADSVLGFILRGIFLGTQEEINWLYQADGAAHFFPDAYQEFLAPLNNEEKKKPLHSYYHLLNQENEVATVAASKSWYLWELKLSSLEYNNINTSFVEDTHQAICMAKITSHYLANHCFIPKNYIALNIDKIKHIPSILIHGRFDMVCRLSVAYRLSNIWDNATLQIMPQAGHGGFESQTIDAFCKATDVMANFLQSTIDKDK